MINEDLMGQFERASEKFFHKVIIETLEKRVTYGELWERAKLVGGALQALGVSKGDCVGVCLANSMELVEIHLGINMIGAIRLPLNPRYTYPELKYILENSRAKILFTERSVLNYLKEIPSLKSLTQIVAVDGYDQKFDNIALYQDLLSKNAAVDSRITIAPNDTIMICYTSGTTGKPKGAMLTSQNLLSNIRALVKLWEWTDQDRLLLTLPLFHMHGLGVCLHGILITGSCMELCTSFDAGEVLEKFDEGDVTLFMGVPTMYYRMLRVENAERFDLKGVRLLVSGSAPLDKTTFHDFKNKFGHEILERYGTTETAMISSNSYQGKRKPGSAGHPLSGIQIKIVDEKENSLDQGGVGEVMINGPNVCKGYLNNPAETEKNFRNGWYHTGDLGRLDDDGYLFLMGRSKDLIISGGFNIYPTEVEEVLNSHPRIKESAVVGRIDPDLGETVLAFIVSDDKKIEEKELVDWCRKYMTGYKIPKQVMVLDELPRNSMGKVDKKMLRVR